MSTTDPAPLPPVLSGEDEAAPTTSVFAKMFNVFTEPGEVFEEVRGSRPNYLNWLLPLLLSIVFGVGATFIVFAQPAVRQQLRELTGRAIEKQVAAGNVNRQQAEAQMKIAEMFSGPVVHSIQVVVGNLMLLFLTALVLWTLGSWIFKAPFGYSKAMEIAGLSSMITVLGAVVTGLLVVITGNMYMNPGPVLLVARDFQPANRAHLLLGMLNFFSYWHLFVLSLGLARLARISWLRAFLWLMGLWALLTTIQFAVAVLAGGL